MHAVLLIPDFPLHAVLRETGSRTGPCAVLDAGRSPPVVIACDAAARARGIQPGLTATQARARFGHLHLVHANPAAERSAREALLDAARTLAPRVEDTAPGVCTIDLTGTDPASDWNLRGGEVVRALSDLGLPATAGFAATPDVARLAAARARPVLVLPPQETRTFLGKLPVAEACPPAELASVLGNWGVRTLGDLADLPSSEIARRLGAPGLTLHALARGGSTRPLQCAEPPARFDCERDLPAPAESAEPVLFLLNRLLGQLCVRLRNAGRAAGRARLLLRLDSHADRVLEAAPDALTPRIQQSDTEPGDAPSWSCDFALPRPTQDPAVLLRLFQTRLDTLRTGAPVTGLALELVPCDPASRQEEFLDSSLRDPARFAETLAALVALAGDGRVGTPVLEDSHAPDAFRIEPPADAVPPRPADTAPELATRAGTTLPLRRFRPPLAIDVDTGEDGRPRAVRHAVVAGPVVAARGPWRSSGLWWEQGRAWAREEWDVELAPSGLCRIHRDAGRWFLDGLYG